MVRCIVAPHSAELCIAAWRHTAVACMHWIQCMGWKVIGRLSWRKYTILFTRGQLCQMAHLGCHR